MIKCLVDSADGTKQRVLVPQLYVRVQPGDISGDGALLSADAMVIRGKGDLTNRGTIAGRTLVAINADSVNNLGRIAGASVAIDARGDLNSIGGSITGHNAVSLKAGNDINIRTITNTQSGWLAGKTHIDRIAGVYVSNPGGILVAGAGHDVNVIGAILSNTGAGGFTSLSAGNDIQLGTVAESDSRLMIFGPGKYRGEASSREVGSTLAANGTTILNAGNDLRARQASVDAGSGLLSVNAERDIDIAPGHSTTASISGNQSSKKGLLSTTTNTFSGSSETSTSAGSRFSGGVVAMGAGSTLNLEGSHVAGTQGVLLSAGNNLNIYEGRDTTSASAEIGKKTSSPIKDPVFMQNHAQGVAVTKQTNIAAPSTVASSEGGIALQGGAVNIVGARIEAAKNLGIVGGEVNIAAATSASQLDIEERKRGGQFSILGTHDFGSGLGAKSKDAATAQQTSLARTSLSGANIDITAVGADGRDGELRIAGTSASTPGALTLNAGTLHLDTQSTSSSVDVTSKGGDRAWQQAANHGRSDETLHYNRIDAGHLVVNTQRVQAGLGARDSVEALARQPGMGWIGQLGSNPQLGGKIDWVKIEEAHRSWNYSQQGLTPEAAAVVTLVVGYFTAGAGSGIGGAVAGGVGATGTTATIVSGAVAAGVTTLTSQAAVALLNNRGDVGAALNELGSSQNVKNLVGAILTGGVLAGLDMNPLGLPGGGDQLFTAQLQQNLTAGAARAVINTAINGGSFERNLKDAIKGAILDTAAAQAAFAIGDAALDSFTSNVAHAIAGCAVGSARGAGSAGEGCAAGAIGAIIGHLAVQYADPGAIGGSQTVQFAAMMAGIAVAITGGDAGQINVASQAGANAAANNYLEHPERIRDPQVQDRILAAGQDCRGPTSCKGVAAQAQAQVDLLSDAKIAAMCGGDLSCVEDRQLERSVYVRTRDEALARLDPNAAAAKFLSDQAGKSPYGTQELSAAVTRMQDGRADESNPVDQYVRDTLASNAPLFASVLGISLIDGDGGKSARKGPAPGQRAVAAVDEAYVKRTDQAALAQLDLEHIAQGHINRSGRAVGFHHEPSGEGTARVISYTKPPDANGVYVGRVQVQNAAGKWVDKLPPSTFFPQNWSEARLNYELAEAFRGKGLVNDQWIGRSPSGIDIEFVPPNGSVSQWRGWPVRAR